jgi:hypothetical protein
MTDDLTVIVPAVTAVVSAGLAFAGTLYAQARQRDATAKDEAVRWEQARAAQREDWSRDQSLSAVAGILEASNQFGDAIRANRTLLMEKGLPDDKKEALTRQKQTAPTAIANFEKNLSRLQVTVSQETWITAANLLLSLQDVDLATDSSKDAFDAAVERRVRAEVSFIQVVQDELGIVPKHAGPGTGRATPNGPPNTGDVDTGDG